MDPTSLPPPTGRRQAPPWVDELILHPGPPWRSMGVRTLDLDDWLVIDDRFDAELELKRSLLRDRPADVFAARPTADEASIEVLELIVGWLAIHHPDRVPVNIPADVTPHPLDGAGRLVQEDLCLMVPNEGTYRLEAASLCFPSHWRLHDKLGRSLAAIHAPVPHYAEELEAKVDLFFHRLHVDRPVQRRNLSIHSHDTLFSPGPFESPASFAADAGGIDQVWLRSERQTLVRLPRTGAVLFTIKTQLCPAPDLASRPDVAGALAATLRAEGADLTSRGDRVPFPSWLPGWLESTIDSTASQR